MSRRYRTVDVFTDRLFGGNPLAVVLDAEGLGSTAMQQIAAEFGYSETTFVLPPRDPAHDALVRIFTPRSELPFAGHPTIGTAFVLAGLAAVPPDRLVFEQAAGLVTLRLDHDHAGVRGATLTAPQPLRIGRPPPLDPVAACLGLSPADLRGPPCLASVGIPFVFAELASRDALARAAPDLAAHQALLPFDGADGVYAYIREGRTLHARMFAPIDGIVEDPATGSATAAVAALLADQSPDPLMLDVHQGDDMGRPSRMRATATRTPSGIHATVGGACIDVMQGTIRL